MVLGLMVIGARAVAAMNPGVAQAFHRGIYPEDPAKRQAARVVLYARSQIQRSALIGVTTATNACCNRWANWPRPNSRTAEHQIWSTCGAIRCRAACPATTRRNISAPRMRRVERALLPSSPDLFSPIEIGILSVAAAAE